MTQPTDEEIRIAVKKAGEKFDGRRMSPFPAGLNYLYVLFYDLRKDGIFKNTHSDWSIFIMRLWGQHTIKDHQLEMWIQQSPMTAGH